MENIFYGAFNSINGNVHEVFIYDKDSTDPDNPTTVILETPGYLLAYDSAISDIVEYGICSSTVKIDIRNIGNVLDSFLNSLYTSENRYIVEIKINSNRYWVGVLLSDFSSVEDAAYSRITLEAVDGLKLLTDEVEIIDENVKHSFLDYIIKALSLMPTAEMFLDTDSFAVVRTDWFSYLMDAGAEDDPLNLISCADTANSFLWETKSSRSGWNGETVVSIKAITYYEMLQKILKHFMVVLAMNNGKWYLAQRDLYESANTLNFYQYTKTAALIMDGLHPDYLTETTYITNGALLKNYRSDGSFSFLPALKQAEITFISSSNGNPSMVSKEEIELMLSAAHTYVSPTLYSGTGNFISMCFDFFDRWIPSGAYVNDIWNAFVTFNVQVKLVGSTTTYYLTRAGSYGIAEYVWTTTPGVIPFAPIQLMGIIVTDWNITGPVYHRSVQQDYFIQMTSVDLPVDGHVEISFTRNSPVGTSMAPLNPNNAPIPPTWALDYSGINIVGTYNNPTTNYIYFIEANEDPTTSVYFRAENDIEGFTLINTIEDGIFGTSGIAARSLLEIWDGSSWIKPTIAQMKYWRKGSTGTFDVFFNQLLVDETLSNQENPLLVFNGNFHFRNANILTLFRTIEINYKTNNYRLWANKITYEPNAEKWSGDWFTIRRQKRAWHFTITPGTAITAIPLVPIAASTNYILHRLDLLQVTADAIIVDNHVINSDAFGLQNVNKPRPIPASGVIQFAISSRIINMDSFGNRSAVDDNDLVVYGYLYSYYTLDYLASSAEWRVPNDTDINDLYSYITGLYPGGDEGLHVRSIRQDGTSVTGGDTTVEPYFENSVLEGLDTLNLGLIPGGCYRGGFTELHQVGYYWTTAMGYEPITIRVYFNMGTLDIGWDAGDNYSMFSVRLVRDASSTEAGLEDGTYVDDYVGNDGKKYAAVKIGNYVWMAENLAETKNNNGTSIIYGIGQVNRRTSYNANNALAIQKGAIKEIVSDTDTFEGIGTADAPLALLNAEDGIVYGIKNGKYEPIPASAPGGNDTEVQFNDAAAFAGDSTFKFNKITKVVDISKLKLAAGTTALPPIQFTSGDLLPAELPGALEFQNDDLYLGISTGAETSSISQYPPLHNDTYVKATSYLNSAFYPYFATNPLNSLIDTQNYTTWVSGNRINPNRFHIDLGLAKIINIIYYENHHLNGTNTDIGIKDITLWGSNSASDFADLTYGNDGTWTQITGLSQNYFDQHIAANQADPKYITFGNTTPYRYYALKISSNWGNMSYMAVRRIELKYGGVSYPRCPIVLADENKLTATKIPLASTNGRLIDSVITENAGKVGINKTDPATELQVVGTTRFGSAYDYTEFEADGTRKAVGGATTWRDEMNDLVGKNFQSPSSHITIKNDEATLSFSDACNLDDFVFMNIQINHDYCQGTDVKPHLHWIQRQSDTPNWLLAYRWQENGAEQVTAWSYSKWSGNAFTYGTNTNQITEFEIIGAAPGLSAILQIKIIRDINNDSGLFGATDPVAADVEAYSFDIHIECDTDGSRTEYSK